MSEQKTCRAYLDLVFGPISYSGVSGTESESLVTHMARVWINRVRLSILLMVNGTGKINISLSSFAENLVSLTKRVRPSRPALAHSLSTLRLSPMLSHWIPPDFRSDVHLFISLTATGLVPSLSGCAVASRWRSLPRVRRHRASSPIPVTGAVYAGFTMDQLMYGSLFLHLLTPPILSTYPLLIHTNSGCGKNEAHIN